MKDVVQAFPVYAKDQGPGDELHFGMTKREYFACRFMAAMIVGRQGYWTKDGVAKEAAKCADVLIDELDKPGGGNGTD